MAITKFEVTSVDSGKTQTVDFGTRVINATVAVQGYTVSFGTEDHHVQALNVKTSLGNITGSNVSVSADCVMSDKSNHEATGTVNVLVIAECES